MLCCVLARKERGVSHVSVSVRSERFLNVAYMLMSPAPSFFILYVEFNLSSFVPLRVSPCREPEKEKKKFVIKKFSRFIFLFSSYYNNSTMSNHDLIYFGLYGSFLSYDDKNRKKVKMATFLKPSLIMNYIVSRRP